ncbi:uroporphyrinogen-III synthase [Paenisporosarcina sp. TG20]|uniref:uroporphyrinogen-III synthase n=1 Tax=Paenisporosarcina sp. TG20 TaxID=1211706 RepID=UPI0002D70F02|nr:uroporphyrinogen-III synthase [Paenisporosarcina sp. TG20]
MSKNIDLQGQTIVFTGQPKSDEAFREVERLGGKVEVFPLISTREDTHQDEDFIKKVSAYDWLIFTSQNAVFAFKQKLTRNEISADSFTCKIAAVGSRTAQALEEIGFRVAFIPTTYSATDFVQQFPKVTSQSESCLFLRGSLAKATIKEGLTQQVDEWTVYETHPNMDNVKRLLAYLMQNPNSTVAFASPSSVDIFASYIAPTTGWTQIKIAAIGQVTAAEVESYGAHVHVQSKIYTWFGLVQEIAYRKDDLSK